MTNKPLLNLVDRIRISLRLPRTRVSATLSTVAFALMNSNGTRGASVDEATGALLVPNGLRHAGGIVTTYTGAADAINIASGSIFVLNRSGAVDAATLAAPTAADEGREIWISNGTTQANTITVAGGLGGSGTSYDVLTFTAVVAANVTLRAYNLQWYMTGQHLVAVA